MTLLVLSIIVINRVDKLKRYNSEVLTQGVGLVVLLLLHELT